MGWTRMDRAGEGIALWRPGKADATVDLYPEDLIREFLSRTAGMPPESVASIAGIGTGALDRWRDSDAPRLSNRVRRRLQGYLAAEAISED